MATGALGEALQLLRNLIRQGPAAGLDDGQLLDRYARSRDEAAFEALVARHGPMVLATCRAVLRDEHDVEDAFQATFLILSRKAGTVRAGGALGGWLHRVARRAAVQLDAELRRRRLREARATPATAPVDPGSDDVASVVHGELDRLAERYRLPVVLCDLEGLTYEQAARQLRWTEPTLRHRLARARTQLRERMTRQGFDCGDLGAVLAGSAHGLRSAVPAALARSALAAATDRAIPAGVVALSTYLIRSMLMTRLKIIAAGVLATLALASVPLVAGWARQIAGPAEQGVQGAAGRAAAADAGRRVPGIEGRVVDPEGRPVAGARVAVMDVWTAPGNDLSGWLERARDRGVSRPSEGLSPGALVAVPATRSRTQPPPQPPRNFATTGPDGRFRLAGVGPDQLARIVVTGPSLATSELYASGRDGEDVHATLHQGLKPTQVTFHARRLECVAPPGKPIQGVVRDKDSGRPLGGIALRAAVYEEHNLVPASDIGARTDEQGRYRIDGLPRAPAYRLFVEPDGGEPYLKATLRVAAETSSFEPVPFDVKLGRGVVVRGRVTDRATGRPVRASIDVYAFADNPHPREFPGYLLGGSARVFSGIDGRYEAIAVPGRGLVAVEVGGYLAPYRVAANAGTIRGFDPGSGGFRTIPSYCHADSYHALAEIDLDPKAGPATVDLQVDPGRTVQLTAFDPEGRPVPGTTASGVSDMHPSSEYTQESPTFEILALDPSRPRRVTVTHAARNLVGSIDLKGDEAGPLTLTLRPAGTITGRIVDDEGRPRGGLVVRGSGAAQPTRPGEQGTLPGADIRVGRDGRFRIGGLVPGLRYGGEAGEGVQYHGELFRDVTMGPGEVKDLGDIKPTRPKRAE